RRAQALGAELQAAPLGLSAGYGATIIDTALAASSPSAADWLAGQQNADGGWPFVPGGPSRIEPTARVLQVLTGRAGTAAAYAWLASLRQPDGSYRDEDVSTDG